MFEGRVGIGFFLRLGVPFPPHHLRTPWESPSIRELGSFGMEPGSLNQHGTNPSGSSGRDFGNSPQDLLTLPQTCSAWRVPQSHSRPKPR